MTGRKEILLALVAAPMTFAALWIEEGSLVLGVCATGLQLCLLAVLFRNSAGRRRAEERLRRAVVEAEAASRAKSAFLANMSHELRTPLNAIIGFAEALDSRYFGPLSPKQADYVHDIQGSGRHLLGMISDILDLSRIEAGRIELCDETLDLGPMLELCRERVAAQARRGGIRVACIPLDRPLTLCGDSARLERAVMALLVNAVKFTPRGGTVTLSAALRPGGEAALTISDTGIGMTEAEIAEALQPFHQIGEPLIKRYEGAGLGLPLARSLIDLHGGRLEIDSRRRGGTTVSAVLPADRMRRCKAVA